MESVHSSLITQIINDTLAMEPQATKEVQTIQLAQALISNEAAALRTPVKQDGFSKFIRVLRDTLCKDNTRVYYDLKESLTELAKGLRSGEIHFTVQDAKREKALRTYYHGDGKEVIVQAAANLHEAITKLGLSDSKVQKLQALVDSITDSLKANPTFREEFQEHNREASIIDECVKELANPGADLAAIGTTLQSVKVAKGTQSALSEKLKNAQDKLEVKTSVNVVKASLAEASSVKQLFQIAAEAIKDYNLDPELKQQFTEGVEHELKRSVGKMMHAFETESLQLVATMGEDQENFFTISSELKAKFKKIVLNDDVIVPQELAGAKEHYHKTAASCQKVQSAYLRVYKKQLKFEAIRFSTYIEKETNLQRLALCKQNMNTLYTIVESCERATSSEVSPEVAELVDAIQEQLDKLERTLAKQINEQAVQQQKALQEELARLDAEIQKNKMLQMIGNKEHTVVHITQEQEPSQKLSVTALGVALSALKWVPVVGQPVAELGEAVKDKTPNFLEAGISTCLATALLTGYVVYSGVNPMQPGGLIFSAAKVAPLLTPNIVAYFTRQCPPGSVLPRPLALALGMATAGATAYVFYRGPLNIASDVFWYGVENIPGAATAVGGAAFQVGKKATVYAATSTYDVVSSSISGAASSTYNVVSGSISNAASGAYDVVTTKTRDLGVSIISQSFGLLSSLFLKK